MRLKKAKKTPKPITIWKPNSNGTTFQNPYAQVKYLRPLMGQAAAKEKREFGTIEKVRKRFSLKDWLRRRIR